MRRLTPLILAPLSCSDPASEPATDLGGSAALDVGPDEGGPAGPDSVSPDAPPPDTAVPGLETPDTRVEPTCESLPLLAEIYDGLPTALYAVGNTGAAEGVFHLDTASYTSLLFLPAGSGWQDHAGDVRFGCRDVPVPGWDGLGTLPDVQGYPVIGMAGIDLFRLAPTRLDVAAAAITWDPPDFAARPGAIDLPHEWVQGELLVDVRFDDVPVTVVVDTGAAHTLWLGVQPEPGDQPVTTEDALGDPLTVWLGQATLGLGDVTVAVPMLRAPSFPILEETEARLGRTLGGLIGLSAMERLYVDAAEDVAAIRPRSP